MHSTYEIHYIQTLSKLSSEEHPTDSLDCCILQEMNTYKSRNRRQRIPYKERNQCIYLLRSKTSAEWP